MRSNGRSRTGTGRPVAALAATLALCAIWAPRARAQARRVAIISLSSDDEAGARAARQVRQALRQTGLEPLAAGDLARALEGPRPESATDAALAAARELLQQSRSKFDSFMSTSALDLVERARQMLLTVTTGPRVLELLSEISFHAGLIHLRDQDRGSAVGELALARRLSGDRPPLDPVRFAPDILAADRDAGALAAVTTGARLSISSTFDGIAVHVDGVARGHTPTEIELGPGWHIVSVTSPRYRSASERIKLDRGDPRELRFDLEAKSSVELAAALRERATGAELEKPALADVGAQVAELAGADAVVILADREGVPHAMVYDPQTRRLSYARPADDSVGKMLGLLVPVPEPPTPEDPTGPVNPGPSRPWRAVAIGSGIAFAALAIGVVLLAPDDELAQRTWTSPGWK